MKSFSNLTKIYFNEQVVEKKSKTRWFKVDIEYGHIVPVTRKKGLCLY